MGWWRGGARAGGYARGGDVRGGAHRGGARGTRIALGLCLLALLALTEGCGVTASGSRLFTPSALGAAHGVAGRPGIPTDNALALAYMKHLTLDQKIGQLFLAEFDGPAYSPDNAAMVEQEYAGGILLYNREMPDAASARNLIAAAQAHSKVPLFVVVDEEGGYVDRLSDIYGFRPSAEMIGATGSAAYARAQAIQVAHDMRALGLNFDLAPDVDVAVVDGPDQSTRTFGSTPGPVIRLAGAYLQGLQSHGVIGCLKHFPGLGAATVDAHQYLPVIDRTRDQIEQVELAPYRALIKHDAPGCIMSTDLLMPALDPVLPAEISPATITGVLRRELGYDGVVVTDALYMQGISKNYPMPEAGVMAIQAGCDFLMGPGDSVTMGDMIDAIKTAVASGQITRARIDQSVRRILALKYRFGLLKRPRPRIGTGPTGAVITMVPAEARPRQLSTWV